MLPYIMASMKSPKLMAEYMRRLFTTKGMLMTNALVGTTTKYPAPGIILSEMLTVLDSLNGKLKTREEK